MNELLKKLDDELKNDKILLTKELIKMFDYLDIETIANILYSLDIYLKYRVNNDIEPKERGGE